MQNRIDHRHAPEGDRDQTFIRRLMIVLAIGVVMAALYFLSDILLLFFGSILVATILRSVAHPITVRTGLSERIALGISSVIVFGSLGLALWWVGPSLAAQMQSVILNLPEAASRLAQKFEIGPISELFRNGSPAALLGNVVSKALSWGATVVSVVTALILVVFGGIYLAGDPQTYRDGIIKLVPPRLQDNVAATLDDCGHALPKWLGAQVFAMVLVGALTGVGLWLVGVPSALALGVITGLAEFIPYVGPLVAAIPALLLASTVDTSTVWWTLAVLVVVQQLESNVIVPMVANRAVSVQPAVGLYAVVALGILFGPLGLLFGFPLAIVVDIAIRRLYVRDALNEPVDILGEPAKPSEEAVGENGNRPTGDR